jgi:hypothetical protein
MCSLAAYADSLRLDGESFNRRYGLLPGYMVDSNEYFERVASVPAKWNRMIVYNGATFHSAEIPQADRLTADPLRGRLTLNSFFTCSRATR